MSAIITENFRRNNTRLFLNDISDPTDGKYYLGIGKQDRWDNDEENISFIIPAAVGTRADESEVLNNLSTLVSLDALSGIGRVIPAVSWTSGNKYQEYSSYDSSRFYPSGTLQPCYVTINGAIFLCLKTGNPLTGSTVPLTVSTNPLTKYAPFSSIEDGYIWVLVQESPTQIIRNNTFTDIRTTKLTGPTTGGELFNSKAQCGGFVTGFTVVKPGSGYSTSTSTLTLRVNDGFITGDGSTDLSSTTTVPLTITTGAGGAITSVFFTAGFTPIAARGVRLASIEFAGTGTDAEIIPTISPLNGFAYDPSAVMPSWFAGLKVSLNDSVSGDNFYSRYRQISIVKNPTAVAGEENAATLKALKYVTLSNDLPSNLRPGSNSSILKNAAGQTVGYADYYDAATKRLYFHQNLSSGYRELPPTGFIEIGADTTEYAYTSINNSEFINDGNAEVIFTENRSFITRSSGQTEDLIIIIQF